MKSNNDGSRIPLGRDSHLLESLNENTKKLELLTTEKEKSTTETIINGLKDQVNILDQLISAQYVHKNNSLKA